MYRTSTWQAGAACAVPQCSSCLRPFRPGAHFFAVRSHLVAQPLVQQLLAESGERLRIGLRQFAVPADLVRDLERMAEGRRVHQLEILLFSAAARLATSSTHSPA